MRHYQNDLFDKRFFKNAAARHSDPTTSHDAARSIEGTEATRMEAKVFSAILGSHHGLTTHEISEITGIPYWSVTPRIRPLVRKGLIEDSHGKRAGDSGRQSIVWTAAAQPGTPVC